MNRIISAVLEVNGEIITIGEQADYIEPESVEYDADGWSIEMRHGCVRNKRIDAYLNAAANGDEHQRHQAATIPRWFAVRLPTRDYDRATKTLLHDNYYQNNGSFVSTGIVGAMVVGKFYPNIVGDVKGDALVEFATPVLGFAMYSVHSLFPERYITRLLQGLVTIRAGGNKTPGVGNWKG